MAASSGGDAPSSAVAGLDATLVAHKPYIHLDKVGDQYCLTHTFTLHRQVIPQWMGECLITFDEDGFGVIYGDEGADHLFLDQWLTKQLFETDDGRYVVLDGDPQAHERGVFSNLTDRMREWEPRDIHVVGENGEETLQGYLVRFPRGAGNRLFWNAQDFYRKLGLTCHNGESSKWAWAKHPRWRRLLESLGLRPDNILRSSATCPAAEAMVSVDMFLPSMGLSTCLVLILLVRWSYAVPQKLGLTSEDGRAVARRLLDSIVTHAVRKEFQITIEFDGDWKLMWPRPQPVTEWTINVKVDPSGVMHLAEWKSLVDRGNVGLQLPGVIKAWWKHVAQLVDENTTISLHQFLGGPGLSCLDSFQPCWLQVAYQVARRIEVTLYQSDTQQSCDWDLRLDAPAEAAVDDWSARGVDLTCRSHVNASIKASRDWMYCGMAFDKVSCRGLDLFNTFFTLPDNVAFEAVPQVSSSGPRSKDNLSVEDLEAHQDDVQKRHRAFLKREAPISSLRPAKRHRTSVEKALKYLDNQVRVSTAWKGLYFFSRKRLETEGLITQWKSWPHVNFSCDMGSDMVSLVHGVSYMRNVQLNMTEWYDFLHGFNRDFWGAVESCELMQLAWLLMIVMNVAHGPDETDLRFNQMREYNQQHMTLMSPKTSPIFQYLVTKLLKERRFELLPAEGESDESALWRLLRSDAFYKPKGYKCTKGRVGAFINDGSNLCENWYSKLFHSAVPSIEGDMIGGKALTKIKLKVSGGDVASNDDSTSIKRVSVGDRTVRSCGSNAVVMCLAILSEDSHRRLLAILVVVPKPLLAAAFCATKCRSVQAQHDWLLLQYKGDLYDSIYQTLMVLVDVRFLDIAGFSETAAAPLATVTDDDLVFENELAQYAGLYATSLVRNRCRRTQYFWGYPHVLSTVADSVAVANATLSLFELDFKANQDLSAIVGPSEVAVSHQTRSAFNRMSVQQPLLCCHENGFRHHEDIADMMKNRTLSNMQSVGVEHMNNYQKNSRQMGTWGGRYRRPQTALAANVRGNLLTKEHNYKAPAPDHAPATMAPLQAEDMCPTQQPSLPFSDVSGSTAKAPYYTSTAAAQGVPAADLHVHRALRQSGRWGDIDKAWLGFFCDADSQIIFQKKGAGVQHPEDQWHFGLFHNKDSSCVAWPVELVDLPGPDRLVYLKFKQLSAPRHITVFSWDGLEANTVSCKSWVWQRKHGGAHADALGPGLRYFLSGTPASIKVVAAREAFFSWSKADCERVAKEVLGMDLHGVLSLFDLLVRMVIKVLECNHKMALDIVKRRLANLGKPCKWATDMIDIDEAAACLKEEDRADVLEAQSKAVEARQELKDFRKSYKEARASANTLDGTAKAKIPYTGPKKLPTVEHIEQKVAKTYMPPNSYLWRSRNDGAWNSRYDIFPETSARDSAHGGELGALKHCWAHAWEWYLDVNGYERKRCPIQKLLDSPVADGSAPGAASSGA